MRLKKRDVPAPAKIEVASDVPRQVGRRVETIVEQIKKQIEGMGGRARAYRFKIVRNREGLIDEVIATPLEN